MASEELPPARQLVTTWWIPEEYAGQTVATLHRAGEQARRSGRPVDLLTFSPLQDAAEITARLSERGVLPAGVTVRALFSDLRAWDVEGVLVERLAAVPPTAPAPDDGTPTVAEERNRWCRRSLDEHQELVRSETFRADGTVLCRDFPVVVGGRRKRYQQFYDRDGTPTVLVGSAWDVYFVWLDHLVGDGTAVITSESKSTARFLWRYPNPRAAKIHVFHESHLIEPTGPEATDPWTGELGVVHRRIVPRLDRFDAVVFLTRKQRHDVAERYGYGPNLHSVPNAGPPVRPVPPTRSLLPFRRGATERSERGVVVATLKPLKRLEHAVEAVAMVQRAGGRAPGFGLDLYGKDAGSRASIERTIAATGSGGYVALGGYATDAASRFEAASFSLMTSSTEGQSLVLLESMASGCIPISYDIRYGPDELLVDGETGFLVPAGDVAALAEALQRFLSLPARRVRQLRANARERLAAFSDAEVHQRWVAVQHAAVEARSRRLVLTALEVPRTRIDTGAAGFTLDADVRVGWDTGAWTAASPPPAPRASWLLLGRSSGRPWRAPLEVEATTTPDGASLRLTGTLDPYAVAAGEKVWDVHLEVTAAASVRRVRLAGSAEVEVDGGRLFVTSYGNLSLRRA